MKKYPSHGDYMTLSEIMSAFVNNRLSPFLLIPSLIQKDGGNKNQKILDATQQIIQIVESARNPQTFFNTIPSLTLENACAVKTMGDMMRHKIKNLPNLLKICHEAYRPSERLLSIYSNAYRVCFLNIGHLNTLDTIAESVVDRTWDDKYAPNKEV